MTRVREENRATRRRTHFRNTARPSIPDSLGRVSAAISKGIDRQDRDIAVRQEIFL
jgi:hypothetical protein